MCRFQGCGFCLPVPTPVGESALSASEHLQVLRSAGRHLSRSGREPGIFVLSTARPNFGKEQNCVTLPPCIQTFIATFEASFSQSSFSPLRPSCPHTLR